MKFPGLFVIFGCDFGRNGDLINSFWIWLTFNQENVEQNKHKWHELMGLSPEAEKNSHLEIRKELSNPSKILLK